MKGSAPGLILLVIILVLSYSVPGAHAILSSAQLTFNTVSDTSPVISADGSKVAFSSNLGGNYEIFVINSNGTGLRLLTSNPSNDTSPSITANGAKIAYESVSGNDADVFVVNSDGTGSPLRLNPQNNVDDAEPTISGDGSWVAYDSNDNPSHTLCPTCNNPEADPEIFLVRTDGTGLRQLTFNSRDDLSPSISNNGGKIVFQEIIAGTFEIFSINSDGTGLTQVTNNTSDDTSPSISADGSKVAYESNAPATQSIQSVERIRPEPLIPLQVYVANTNGAGLPTQVSATGGDNFSASISGDGSKVAYVSTGDGNREVYRVDSDGTGQPLRITTNTAFDIDPSTDSTGDSIVYASNIDGDFEIFITHITTPPVHNMAVTAITVPRRIGYNTIAANQLKVNVTVANLGTVSDTVTVEISFLNGPTLSSQTTTISPGASKTLTFGVSTQSLAIGSYTIIAKAVPLPGEADISDNTLQDGAIQVRIPGDVDGDRDVDILDAATVAFYYGGTCATPTRYMGAADLDNDCDIDIIDAAVLAFYYGTRA